MGRSWTESGSRKWWAVVIVLFTTFELIVRIKLGSVFVLAGFWALAHQWLEVKLGESVRHPVDRIILALYANTTVCLLIFMFFAVINIGLRTIDPGWRWFQLP